MPFEIENKENEIMFLVGLTPEISPAMRPGTYLITSDNSSREEINAALTEARQNQASVEFKNCWLAILNIQVMPNQQTGSVQILHACHAVPFSMHDTARGSDWVLCPQLWIFPAPELEEKLRSDRAHAVRELSLQKSGLVQAPATALNELRRRQ